MSILALSSICLDRIFDFFLDKINDRNLIPGIALGIMIGNLISRTIDTIVPIHKKFKGL